MESDVERADLSSVDALWLEVLGRIAGRSAHEVKGAMNGVAVNLAVVRSRAEKSDIAAGVAPFALAAIGQLDALIDMTESLLWMARPLHVPVELSSVLTRFAALLVPAAKADGRALIVDDPARNGSDGDVIGANANAVRLALGSSLLAALESANTVTVRRAAPTQEKSADPWVCIESDRGVPLVTDPMMVDAVTGSGIQVVAESSAVFIRFPRLAASTENA